MKELKSNNRIIYSAARKTKMKKKTFYPATESEAKVIIDDCFLTAIIKGAPVEDN